MLRGGLMTCGLDHRSDSGRVLFESFLITTISSRYILS